MEVFKKFKTDTRRLEETIRRSGLKKSWIAQQLGVDKSTVSRWVTGKTEPPYEMLLFISELLRVDISELEDKAA